MLILGRAEWYRIKTTLRPIPIRMPISSGSTRQAIKAASPGIRSISVEFYEICVKVRKCIDLLTKHSLLLRHIGLTTLYSTMKMTAAIIIAPRAALGM